MRNVGVGYRPTTRTNDQAHHRPILDERNESICKDT
jgi:hypothetical protein